MRSFQARLVPVDRQEIKASVLRMLRNLGTGYWARNPSEPLGNQFGFVDHMTYKDMAGKTDTLEVQYRSKESNNPSFFLGGGAGLTQRTKRPAVVILMNGRFSAEDFTQTEYVKDEAFDVLIHELTHKVDVYFKPAVPTSQRVLTEEEMDLQEYYNRSGEVRAFMREVIEQVMRILVRLPMPWNVNEEVKRALGWSDSWARIYPYLNERNKQLVLWNVYQAAREYQEQGKMKAAACELVRIVHGLIAEMEN